MWFPYSSFQQVRQPSIMSPVEEDTPKLRDTTGTVFIQGPSIVLPVWRCIMFSGSYLRVRMKLQIVQKIRFSLHESGRTKPWCPSLVSRSKHRNQWQEVEGLLFSPQKIIFSHLESGWTKPWCPGLVSRPSAKHRI